MISFNIPIEPKSLQFSGKRLCTINGRPRFFKTSQAKSWETEVRLLCAPYLPKEPFNGPISLSLLFVFARPKRLMSEKHGDYRIFHTQRPDADNLSKGITDCLADFWEDDSQICTLTVRKCFASRSEQPAVWVEIDSLDRFQRFPQNQ
jgi:Holliday junction resolvase RusA-like endonuclease